jgi:hypothetical protein
MQYKEKDFKEITETKATEKHIFIMRDFNVKKKTEIDIRT